MNETYTQDDYDSAYKDAYDAAYAESFQQGYARDSLRAALPASPKARRPA